MRRSLLLLARRVWCTVRRHPYGVTWDGEYAPQSNWRCKHCGGRVVPFLLLLAALACAEPSAPTTPAPLALAVAPTSGLCVVAAVPSARPERGYAALNGLNAGPCGGAWTTYVRAVAQPGWRFCGWSVNDVKIVWLVNGVKVLPPMPWAITGGDAVWSRAVMVNGLPTLKVAALWKSTSNTSGGPC